MNRITKTLVSLLLCCCLCLNLGSGVVGSAASALTLRANAEEEINLGVATPDDMRKALDSITKAMKDLDLEGNTDAYIKAYNGFMGVMGFAGAVFGAVNGAYTFLKLVGIINDPVAAGINNILASLERVEGKLGDMDKKLDQLTQSMIELKAETAFYTRGLSAQSYNKAWNDFYLNNVTNVNTGTSSLMDKYNYMLKAGVQRWCENNEEGDRVTRSIDNASRLVLLYANVNDSWILVPTLENDIPDEYKEYRDNGDLNHAYLVLNQDSIPEKVAYNVDKLADVLPAAFKAGIEENKDKLDKWNFDLTEENIEQAAEDAYVLLNHRVAAAQMQTSTYEQLATEVMNAFKNFCTNMLATRDGMDAMYQSLMLTHGFEGEITESINLVTDQLIALTSIYGPFVASVMSQSTTVSSATKESIMTTWVNTINELAKRRENFLTGNPRYSYVLGGVVTPVKLNQEVNIWESSKDEAHKNQGTDAFVMWEDGKDKAWEQQPQVSSDKFALLNLYYKQSGQTEGTRVESFKKYLTQGQNVGWFDDDNTLVLNFTKPIPYNFSSVYVENMMVKRAMCSYDWWGNDEITDLRYLPGKAESQYFTNNQMIQGTVYDMSTGNIASNQVLMAKAIYAESHWIWRRDESWLFAKKLDWIARQDYTWDGILTIHFLTGGDRTGIRVAPPENQVPNSGFSSLYTYDQTIAEIEENLPMPEPAVTKDNCFIGVTVYDGYQPAEGAIINLMLNGGAVHTFVTGPKGEYMSPYLNEGDYNVVVTYRGEQQTKSIELLPDSATNISFTFNGNTVSKDPENPFADITAEDLPQNLTLVAGWYAEKEGTILSDLRAAAGNAVLEVVELSLLDENNDFIHEPSGLVTIKIPYNVKKTRPYAVYRSHNGAVEVLTDKPNADGEYMELGEDSIILHAKKFSVYAIASAPKSSPVKPDTDEDKDESKPIAAPAVNSISPKTGDNSTVVLMVSLLGVCALLTAAGAKRREE